MSANAATPKPAARKATQKPAKPSVHPPVAAMVPAALAALKDRKGSSLQAIKKYIQANYKGIDMDRLAPFIRRFLKKAVDDKNVVQTKGTYKAGAKPKADKPKEKKPAAKKAPKPKKVKTPKKTVAKKSPKKVEKKPAAKKVAKKPAAKKAATKAVAKKVVKKPAAKKVAKKPAAKKE